MSDDFVRIILGRHAESDGNVNPEHYVIDGDSKVGITQKGVTHTLASGEFLSGYFDDIGWTEWPEIYISSYLRTLQTFRGVYEKIKNNFDGDPQLKEDARLIEKFFGAASQLHFADPKKIPPEISESISRLSKWTNQKDPFSAAHLFGESTLATEVRVKGFIDGTLRRDIQEGKRNFFIVTHGAVIQSFVRSWMHIPMRFKNKVANPNNNDFIEISGMPKNWSVRKIYDGEKMEAVDIDLIAGIERLTVDTLPPLPFPVQNP